MNKWRAMTDQELEVLRNSLAERRACDQESRGKFRIPDAAQHSIAGALYWSLTAIWQDRPVALVAGILILIWQIAQLLVDTAQS